MDFKQIEAFINVAKYRSFSKAAEAVFLSQPTISTHINSLENELDVVLFDRYGKDVQLTPAGILFYDYAINMYNTRNQAFQSIAEFYKKIEGELFLASSTTPTRSVLPEIMGGFTKKFPQVNYRISEMSSNDVISSLLRSEAELGIVGKVIDNDRLIYYELTDDNLVLITPATEKYAKIKDDSVELKSILTEKFILREKNSATRQIFESALENNGLSIAKLNVLSTVNGIDTALQLVKYGLGVTVLSKDAAKEYVDYGMVKSFFIKELPLLRKIYLVKCEKRTLSPQAKAFEAFTLSLYNS
ncbi:HTH-type transcriptional regulator CysL [Oxobacter pfennigii]|uniref:HTH-type transcriptional regulator CysL n=1 Tax=Oxobacter pfennigii TaxID=36849 RepID=A0A0P8YT46_9CLOT|nr:selenium metabolism-associated LysR family transcriptional regulator [Oxobacter pfennigii]KPU42853.1 HTH-type transcriptional regulator CysL [Oxobacter pfennigii]